MTAPFCPDDATPATLKQFQQLFQTSPVRCKRGSNVYQCVRGIGSRDDDCKSGKKLLRLNQKVATRTKRAAGRLSVSCGNNTEKLLTRPESDKQQL